VRGLGAWDAAFGRNQELTGEVTTSDSQSEPQPVKCWAGMLPRVSSRPIRTHCKPPGFILPCQPALADRPPSGPGWLHEIKFDGCRVIARRDGEQIRLWARTTSDYSRAFTRIRDALAALRP
jgi:bifunctional non-homologous end joining protein LigD